MAKWRGRTEAVKFVLDRNVLEPGPKRVASAWLRWKVPDMKTLTADRYKRVRIPDAKPQQVFAYANNGDGSFTLTPLKAERKQVFPRGSLLKYLTPERDKERLAMLSGCVQVPPSPK